MKKSKIMNLEEEISDSDVDSDIEIKKTKSKKQVVEEIENEDIKTKVKPKKTEKQIEAWNKALKIREENRIKRKKEKEEEERQQKEKLESKILLKARRIKKAQTKILGDDLDDEIEMIQKPKKHVKKKVIIYKSESESDSVEEQVIIKKNKPKPKEIKKHLPDNNNVINNPTYRRVINYV